LLTRGRIRKNIRFEIRKFLRFSNFSAFENRFEFESNIFLPLHVVFRNTFRIIRIEYLLRTTVGVTKNSSSGDTSALDVSAIAERHQQEQLDEAWDTLAVLLQRNMIQQKHVTAFQTLYRENIQGKEKVTKLKNLLAIC
jgi:hypothetical protein